MFGTGPLLGRVNSVYYTFAVGGFALGSLTGGAAP